MNEIISSPGKGGRVKSGKFVDGIILVRLVLDSTEQVAVFLNLISSPFGKLTPRSFPALTIPESKCAESGPSHKDLYGQGTRDVVYEILGRVKIEQNAGRDCFW